MLRSKIKEEIKNFINLITLEELETNRELNEGFSELGELTGDYYPRRKMQEDDLPEFVSYDLLFAEENTDEMY